MFWTNPVSSNLEPRQPRADKSGAQVTALPDRAVGITPSDSSDLAQPVSVYVGGGGAVKVTPAGAATPVTFVGLTAGQLVPVQVIRVWATGTTATGLVGVY